jgi:hypothetical protein
LQGAANLSPNLWQERNFLAPNWHQGRTNATCFFITSADSAGYEGEVVGLAELTARCITFHNQHIFNELWHPTPFVSVGYALSCVITSCHSLSRIISFLHHFLEPIWNQANMTYYTIPGENFKPFFSLINNSKSFFIITENLSIRKTRDGVDRAAFRGKGQPVFFRIQGALLRQWSSNTMLINVFGFW